MQSGIINDLYMRLAQYESIEEMEKQSAAGVIAEAENLKKSIFDE